MAVLLTSRQCRKARHLLKWNIHDITSQVRVDPRKMEKFERGTTRLLPHENNEIVKLFLANNIVFAANYEVELKTDKKNKKEAKYKDLLDKGAEMAKAAQAKEQEEKAAQKADETPPPQKPVKVKPTSRFSTAKKAPPKEEGVAQQQPPSPPEQEAAPRREGVKIRPTARFSTAKKKES